jgi:hypothetical protein
VHHFEMDKTPKAFQFQPRVRGTRTRAQIGERLRRKLAQFKLMHYR